MRPSAQSNCICSRAVRSSRANQIDLFSDLGRQDTSWNGGARIVERSISPRVRSAYALVTMSPEERIEAVDDLHGTKVRILVWLTGAIDPNRREAIGGCSSDVPPI